MVTNPQALRIGLYNSNFPFTLAVEKPPDPDFLFFKDVFFFLDQSSPLPTSCPMYVRVIQDSLKFLIPCYGFGSRYWIPVFVSGIWIPDSNC